MLGPAGSSRAERWVAEGRLAAALPGVARIVLAAPPGSYPGGFDDWTITCDFDAPAEVFHFGRRLSELLGRYPDHAYLYLGAGSVPLLPAATLAQVVSDILQSPSPLAITNNLHSSDWLAFNCPADIQARPERLANDNALGWVLRSEAGVEVRSLPPSAAARLDIDTPADLLLLA